MNTAKKQHFSLAYEHEGEIRHATADLTPTKTSIQFAGLSSIKFQIPFSDPERVVLLLPSDRKGQKPSVTCDISTIPELGAALAEMRKQGWLGSKEASGHEPS